MKIKRSAAVLSALAFCILCLTGCDSGGKGKETTPPEETSAIEQPVEGDYQSRLEAVTKEIEDDNAASAEVDYTDAAAVQEYVENTKAMYQKLADLEAPADLADAQAKLKTGAEKMIEYLDLLPAYCALEEGSEEWEQKRNEVLNTYSMALASIAEGNAIIHVGGDTPAA